MLRNEHLLAPTLHEIVMYLLIHSFYILLARSPSSIPNHVWGNRGPEKYSSLLGDTQLTRLISQEAAQPAGAQPHPLLLYFLCPASLDSV